MKLSNKIFSLLAVASLVYLAGCSDKGTDDPDPVVVEPTCQLNSISEVDNNDPWNITLTYDAAGNLITREDQDSKVIFGYTNGKLNTMTNDGTVGTFSYTNGTYPTRFEINTNFFILTYNGDKITTMEDHYLVDNEDILSGITEITYTATGNVSAVSYKEYDADTDKFTTTSSISAITTDDKKNPYATSFALLFYELIEGDELNLGKNNPVTARYKYGTTVVDALNTYEYNGTGYPAKRTQTGFSSPTEYNFSYTCK